MKLFTVHYSNTKETYKYNDEEKNIQNIKGNKINIMIVTKIMTKVVKKEGAV